MFYRAISLLLTAVLVHGSVAAQDQPQPPRQTVAQMQQVLHRAQDKDKTVKVTLKTKIDNQKKFSGKVSEVSDSGFVLTNQKSGKVQKLAYEDIEQVKQAGMSKGTKIALGVTGGVVVAVVIFAIWARHNLKIL